MQYFASVLVYMSIWATFSGMLNIGLWGLISGSFCAPKKNMIQVFSHFLKYFPLGTRPSSLHAYEEYV